jgi:hypothetical protein
LEGRRDDRGIALLGQPNVYDANRTGKMNEATGHEAGAKTSANSAKQRRSIHLLRLCLCLRSLNLVELTLCRRHL